MGLFLTFVFQQINLYSVIQISLNISFDIQKSECVSDDDRHYTFTQV
jgi:hypothetical protein